MNSTNQNNTDTQLSRAIWPGLIVALMIAVSLSGIVDHDLWTPDEPREAAIALSMSRTGNMIIPELAGTPFVEKPPLFYIVASFFLTWLGPILGNTPALRLVSACFGLLTLLFTYLLGKIYFDRQKALVAAAILATMLGFIHVTHWLLVDNALMFFITATIWALAEAYERRRLSCLPLAGILAAFAFLTKGLIGPLIIFFAWLGLFIPWIMKSGRWNNFLSIRSIGYHALGFIAVGLISAVWIIAFALKGGPELFREWWWTNHFGRFTGQAINLGHVAPWYYYFKVLPFYLLPWIVPFVLALIVLIKNIARREAMPPGSLLFMLWALGAFALLSFSATKRDIYLCVLLPAGALLCTYGLKDAETGMGKMFYRVWLILAFAFLSVGAAAPLFAIKIPNLSLNSGWQQLLILASIIVALFTLRNATASFRQRFLIVTAMFYATLLTVCCPAIDKFKSYGPAFRATAMAIKACPRAKIAAQGLDETTLAGFYYYCDLVFPLIPDQQTADDILSGRNAEFNGVLTLEKNILPKDLPDGGSQVIFESHMGKRRLLRLFAAPK